MCPRMSGGAWKGCRLIEAERHRQEKSWWKSWSTGLKSCSQSLSGHALWTSRLKTDKCFKVTNWTLPLWYLQRSRQYIQFFKIYPQKASLSVIQYAPKESFSDKVCFLVAFSRKKESRSCDWRGTELYTVLIWNVGDRWLKVSVLVRGTEGSLSLWQEWISSLFLSYLG